MGYTVLTTLEKPPVGMHFGFDTSARPVLAACTPPVVRGAVYDTDRRLG